MKRRVLVLLLGTALSAVPSAAFANDEEAGCFENLANCYYDAARRDSWLSRWLAGLDCELDFIECSRLKVVGR
jgi:hypothetical protein